MAERVNKNNKSQQQQRFNFRKTVVAKPEVAENVLYVNTKSNFKSYMKRCNDIIENDKFEELIIYCLGASVQRGILLALDLQDRHPLLQLDVKTLTTTLTDDLEPCVDDEDYKLQKRLNSSLRITLQKCSLQ